MKKMKLILLVMGLVMPWTIFAQTLPINQETKKVEFIETVQDSTGLSKDELLERIKGFLVKRSQSEAYVLDDKANYKVIKDVDFIIQLTYDYRYKSQNKVTFKATVSVKEGKYRFIFTDFTIYNIKSGPSAVKTLELAFSQMNGQNKGETNKQVTDEVNKVIADLKNFVKKKEEKKEDW